MDDFFINPARMDAFLAGSMPPALREQPLMLDKQEQMSDSASYEVENGTAIIPVRGALVSAQIPGWYWYGSVTYENIIGAVRKAVTDSSVRRILMSFYSPGGTVTGCAEAGAQLDRLAEEKPIWAHCHLADSAAYWLASATNRIVVDPTGEVGSIGVIMTHMDVSKMYAEFGVKITHLTAGKHKADGSPFKPLGDAAKARFVADMEYLRGEFVDAVAQYRGMDREELLATEALTYKGRLAVEAGLADETAFYGDLLERIGTREFI